MTTAQLDHLRAIGAHLERLLEIAKKRTPGRWEKADDCVRRNSSQAALIVVFGRQAGLTRIQDEQDATFIAACAGNAEAGWVVARSTIEQIISMRKDTTCWDFVGKPLMKSILAQWPLETFATAKV